MIKKRGDTGVKNLDAPNAFIEYSINMDDVYNNIDNYSLRRKRKILIVFYHTVLFLCSNRSQTEFYTLPNNETS